MLWTITARKVCARRVRYTLACFLRECLISAAFLRVSMLSCGNGMKVPPSIWTADSDYLPTTHMYSAIVFRARMKKNISSIAVLLVLLSSILTMLATPVASSETSSSSTAALASTTTTVACASSPAIVFHDVLCTATVTGNFPRGKVTWSDGGVQKLSRDTCSLFIGSCSVVFRPMSGTSPVTITTSYGGDKHNSPSSGSISITVTLKGSETKAYCWPDEIVTGSTKVITCVGWVSGHRPTGTLAWTQTGGTGSVTFTTGTCTLATRHCSVKLNAGSTGTITVQAAYSGDANNTASSGTTQLTIKAKTSLANVCSATSVAVGSSITCTATLTGFTGSVSGETIAWYQIGGNGSATFSSTSCTLSSGGTCSITITGSEKGHVGMGAFYLGDAANTRSSGSAHVVVS